MDWKALGEQAAKIGLPLLGAVLPIPGGAAIGTALASALGASSADPQDILTALSASADTQLKAKQFEETHQETMLQIQLKYETDQYAAEVSDRVNARAMQVSTRSFTVPILGYMITAGFFGILTFMLKYEVPAGSKDVLNIMLGSLGTAWLCVVNFNFGSSRGSQSKDVLLAQSTPNSK
jgi:hypothetical protein